MARARRCSRHSAPAASRSALRIGPVAIADGSISGETAEDRFFGVTNPGGISSIRISNTAGGIEVDHLQYGVYAGAAPPPPPPPPPPVPAELTQPVPGPTGATLILLVLALGAAAARHWRRNR